MIEQPGGGTRPELPVVLSGHGSSGTSDRVVPLRSILGANAGAIGAPRRVARWGSLIAWCGAVLVCAGSAFAIRDTMFPALGRTEAPSAWEAPTRPIVTIPYLDREGRVPVNTPVAALPPVPAAGGTPLGGTAGATTSVAGTVPNDDNLVTPAPTGSQPVTTTGTSPNQASSPVTATTAPSVTTDDKAPTASSPVTTDTTSTVDSTVTTTVTSNTDPTATTVVDDGTGNQRGRGTGGSAGGSTP